MKKHFGFFSLLLVASCTCKSSYHELALDRKLALEHDGVIIGIEKYHRWCVDKKRGVDQSRYKIASHYEKDADSFERLSKQLKVMIVSHIIESKEGKRKDIYNPFISNKSPQIGYEQGYIELDKLRNVIKSNLIDGAYTHLVFISMGWHNDQYLSIERYNKIVTAIKQNDRNSIFNPYIVAITWPSSWYSNAKLSALEKVGHIASYKNKCDDADEIGFTISNYLLHNIILSTVHDVNSNGTKIKTIAIGHSLGARLISRALFAKDFLKKDESNDLQLDLYIGLEPAFSANRFIKDKGIEGVQYESHSDLETKILITTSRHDKANPVAFWSEHLGGKDALDTVIEYNEDYKFYHAWIIDGKIADLNFDDLWRQPKRVEFIMCDFIKDHNDIFDNEIGLFLFKVIETLES